MICTEQEAYDKWCPQTRAAGSGLLTGSAMNVLAEANENGALPPKMTVVGSCVGSRCMMWSWETSDRQFLEDEASKACTRLNDSDYRGMMEKIQLGVVDPEPRRGFCGLTGKKGL